MSSPVGTIDYMWKGPAGPSALIREPRETKQHLAWKSTLAVWSWARYVPDHLWKLKRAARAFGMRSIQLSVQQAVHQPYPPVPPRRPGTNPAQFHHQTENTETHTKMCVHSIFCLNAKLCRVPVRRFNTWYVWIHRDSKTVHSKTQKIPTKAPSFQHHHNFTLHSTIWIHTSTSLVTGTCVT